MVAAGHTLSHQATHIIDTIADAKIKCNTYNTTSSSSSSSSLLSNNSTDGNDNENQVEVEVEVEMLQEEKELSDLERIQKIQTNFSQWNLLTQGLRSQIVPLLTRINEQKLSQYDNIHGMLVFISIFSLHPPSPPPFPHFFHYQCTFSLPFSFHPHLFLYLFCFIFFFIFSCLRFFEFHLFAFILILIFRSSRVIEDLGSSFRICSCSFSYSKCY